MSKRGIHVKRTLVYEYTVPYNEDYYPGMSLAEAVKTEKEIKLGEIWDMLIEDTPLEDSTVITIVQVKDDEENKETLDTSSAS